MGDSNGGYYDVAVVGAGIVGLAVARELLARQPDARLVVIDKQHGVAQHQTGHNSGVIHSGIYYSPGSLKARLCVEGARLMFEYCDENEIPYERCGKLIVALSEEELPGLDELESRGHANGVHGLRRVTGAEIQEIEPEGRGLSALHSPNTGIVDYGEVARAIERELRRKGVDFALGCEVRGVRRVGEATVIASTNATFRAGSAILCAGLGSDRLAVSAGASPDPRILPFRGAYLHLAADQPPAVRGMIYPVPDPELPFLGVHVTKHIDGHVSLGPTAMLVASREGYGRPAGHPPGCGQHPVVARNLEGRPKVLEDRYQRASDGSQSARAGGGLFAVRACARVHAPRQSIGKRRPRPGSRSGRHPGRRLRDLSDTRSRPRAKCALSGGDIVVCSGKRARGPATASVALRPRCEERCALRARTGPRLARR